MVSNHEVYHHIANFKHAYSNTSGFDISLGENVSTVLFDVLSYFEKCAKQTVSFHQSPFSGAAMATTQSAKRRNSMVSSAVKDSLALECSQKLEKKMKDLLAALSKFPLTKAERLMCVNLAPKSIPEVYCIIEDCSDRFSDEEIENFIEILSTFYP